MIVIPWYTCRHQKLASISNNGGQFSHCGKSPATTYLRIDAAMRNLTPFFAGAQSSWANSGRLYVGYLGSGTLNIEAGDSVTDTDGFLGHGTGSNGTATVTGTGSSWVNSGGLYLGGSETEVGGRVERVERTPII